MFNQVSCFLVGRVLAKVSQESCYVCGWSVDQDHKGLPIDLGRFSANMSYLGNAATLSCIVAPIEPHFSVLEVHI